MKGRMVALMRLKGRGLWSFKQHLMIKDLKMDC
jgi:hypothetical protein